MIVPGPQRWVTGKLVHESLYRRDTIMTGEL